MKTKNLLISAVICILLTSCATSTYYQVYKATPTGNITFHDKALVYEDDNCKVFYDLWDEGGDVGFSFLNKTDKNIYLNLEESFFVLNGQSHNYYKNRVFTSSSSIGTSNSAKVSGSRSVSGVNYLNLLQTNQLSASNSIGTMASSGSSVSYAEEKIICIPSMTSKNIAEYTANLSLYRDCDLLRYPSRKEIKTKTFTKTDSPIVFSNRMVYTVGLNGTTTKFENEFYVSEITNYPDNQIIESKSEVFCNQKGMYMVQYFKNSSPDKFFIKYVKGSDSWTH